MEQSTWGVQLVQFTTPRQQHGLKISFPCSFVSSVLSDRNRFSTTVLSVQLIQGSTLRRPRKETQESRISPRLSRKHGRPLLQKNLPECSWRRASHPKLRHCEG